MFSIVRVLIDRFKVLFVTHAVFELETDLIAIRGERKAELLRRADGYEAEGLKNVAQELRHQADAGQNTRQRPGNGGAFASGPRGAGQARRCRATCISRLTRFRRGGHAAGVHEKKPNDDRRQPRPGSTPSRRPRPI